MAKHVTSNVLPDGFRSELAIALCADDPVALMEQVNTCNYIDRTILVSIQGGKQPNSLERKPWSDQEAQETLVKQIDNEIWQLLSAHKDPANFETLALAVAAKFGCVRVVALLLSDKYRDELDPTYDDHFAIRWASREGKLEVVMLLMNDPRINPSVRDDYAFRLACQHDHVEVAKLLLHDKRVNPSAFHDSALRWALREAHYDIVKLLLSDSRVDSNADCRTQLACALVEDNPQAVAKSLDVCKALGRHGLVSRQSGKIPSGRPRPPAPWTNQGAAQSTVKRIDNELYQLLVSNSVSTRIQFGEIINCQSLETLVFVIAVRFGYTDVVTMLLAKEYNKTVDINFKYDNRHAIIWACLGGHVKIIALLLNDKRVDVSAQVERALSSAILSRQADAVRILLTDDRVIVTSKVIRGVDIRPATDLQMTSSALDTLFNGAQPGIWPRVISNNIECLPRTSGQLRNKLDGLELETSWLLLLCVKRFFSPTVAARVGDVLREVCSEWTRYLTVEGDVADPELFLGVEADLVLFLNENLDFDGFPALVLLGD